MEFFVVFHTKRKLGRLLYSQAFIWYDDNNYKNIISEYNSIVGVIVMQHSFGMPKTDPKTCSSAIQPWGVGGTSIYLVMPV